MTDFLYALLYLFIGWIVAGIYLAVSMRYNKAEVYSDFIVISLLWPFVIVAVVYVLIIYIIISIGRMVGRTISKLMKEKGRITYD
jgi:hypothetical protein